MTNSIRVASINIAGIQAPDKIQVLLNHIRNQSLDVVGLQEVFFHKLPSPDPQYDFVSNIGPKKRGSGILIKRGIPYNRVSLDPDGRLISMDIGSFTFITVYAPSGKGEREMRNEFFRQTIPAYGVSSQLPLVIVGDFNCIEHTNDRTSTVVTCRAKIVNRFLTEMVAGLELVDVWLKLRPNEPGHTFFHSKGSSRLDRVYVSRSLSDSFTGVGLQPLAITDHLCIQSTFSCNFEPPNIPRSTNGLWKLNTGVLSEESYQNEIAYFINSSARHPLREGNVASWWEDILKPGIIRISKRYCGRRARMIRDTRAYYQACIQHVIQADVLDWAAFKELRSTLKSWEVRTLNGHGVRSRCFEGIETESASVFHVRRSRENHRRCSIDRLLSTDGEILSSKDRIAEEMTKHFTSVFKNQPSPDNAVGSLFLDGIRNCCKYTPDLVAPITAFEIKGALLNTKRNKSPGTDGIPYEFYLTFWDTIAPHFLDMFTHILERGSLTPSQGKAAIRLIPKIPDAQRLSEFRPISLLNCDYKLMASVLAMRLRRTLPATIGSHQKGGVPGRLIIDNLCLYIDVIQYIDERGANDAKSTRAGAFAAILGVDLEKAYDLVNRNVLWETLRAMGYPASFIRWLEAMYSMADMSILNGSEVAGTIHDVQSVRQGCPLSMHLFVLYIEPLLVKIAQSLQGIKFFDKQLTVRALVDDVVIFMSSDDDIIKAGEILDLFCQWTRARMNKLKTRALGLGGWRGRSRWPLPWLNSSNTLKLLGIEFSSSIKETEDRVWDKSFGHLQGILRENASRRFNVYQRVNFLKTKALSRTVYLAQVLQCNDRVADRIMSAVMNFVWLGKLERPQKQVVYRAVDQGGLGMIHPNLFYRSLFLKPVYNVLTGPDSPESALLRFWMAFPLRSVLQKLYNGNRRPVAVVERPSYLLEPVRQIRHLIESSILTPGNPMAHRTIYRHWIQEVSGPGKIELAKPHIDWDHVWSQTAALPSNIREAMFLFNQRLLLTKLRCHRFDNKTDPSCPICKTAPETDEHLMLECPSRTEIRHWLEGTIRRLGCGTPPEDFIRGHLGKIANPRTAFTLVAAYVYSTWTERNRQRVPLESEIGNLWASIRPPSVNPRTILT